ncbi:hypothetical protein [Microbacterium sp. Ld4]|uniref:hypothetical protein n=1 Tax=Microbacterium sp. Ld4 TaxID=649157 RepID=UPI0038696409
MKTSQDATGLSLVDTMINTARTIRRADPPFEPHPRRAPVPASIRAELDQTPEWWEREYRTLLARTFEHAPFNETEHEGHDVVEIRTYGKPHAERVCTTCPPRFVPRRTNA